MFLTFKMLVDKRDLSTESYITQQNELSSFRGIPQGLEKGVLASGWAGTASERRGCLI